VQDATAGCEIFLHPSFVESFSLVMMQAWSRSRPVIVNGECEVTLQHVRRSGGGWSYSSLEQFIQGVETLLGNDQLSVEMGNAGRRYVEERCHWGGVANRATGLLEQVMDRAKPWRIPLGSPA
jgi:glycosyltransferase involved in cell wall biosynthesis